MNTTISLNPNGTARCLWTEASPLYELGRLEVRPASTIEFDEATQQWIVRDQKDRVRFFARSRSARLEWEHKNLQPQT